MEPHPTETSAWPSLLPTAARALDARRIDLPVELMGLVTPPCLVQLKFQYDAGLWTVLVLTDPGKPTEASRWLKAYRPKRVEIAPGIAPRALRARFEELPERLTELLSSVGVRHVLVTPQGTASLFIEDDPEVVKAFVGRLQWGRPEVRVRNTLAGPNRARLTQRQLEIVSLAVALGYYEIPRKIDLRSLAKKAGISLGAVSELLRRGETMIVTDYIDSLAEAQWQPLGEFDDIWPEETERAAADMTVISRQRVNSIPGTR